MTMRFDIHADNMPLSSAELCQSANISPQTLLLLVEHDIALPIEGAEPQQWRFHLSVVAKVQKAARLYRDLAIDWADLCLVLQLLDDIAQLTEENKQLKQRLARFGQLE
jgi:chaperone modulatory protein CbpM